MRLTLEQYNQIKALAEQITQIAPQVDIHGVLYSIDNCADCPKEFLHKFYKEENNKYYFFIGGTPEDDEYVENLFVVSKEHWDEHACLDADSTNMEWELPSGFNIFECCESTYQFGGNKEDLIDAMKAMGYTHLENPRWYY